MKNNSIPDEYEQKLKEQESLRLEIAKLKELAEVQDRQLFFEEECFQKLKLENAELLKSRISKEIELRHTENRTKSAPSKPINVKTFTLYDIVIHVNSFQKIEWLIEDNNSLKDVNSFENPPDQIVIGIMGREKVGKSFIMSRLSGVELPVGYNVHTQGLSIKYSKKDYILTTCLDSAGVHAPVYYYDRKVNDRFLPKNISVATGASKDLQKKQGSSNERKNSSEAQEESKGTSFEKLTYTVKEGLKMQMINDRKLTETFIEDFILFVSKVILIVVGQLSQDDQVIIERIRREYKEKKFIIIVHNFMYLSSESSIKAQIIKDIYKSCEVEERGIPGTDIQYYCEKQDHNMKSKYQIAHFVYCQENTEVGQKYNDACLKHIWDKIKTIDEREKFNVIESLRNFFRLNSKNYVKVSYPSSEKNDVNFLESNDFLYEKDPLIDLIHEREQSKISLRVKEDFIVTPQNPTFTALGSLIINNISEFEPKFELIEYADNEFAASFEVCNLEVESLKMDISRELNNENMLVVRGNKLASNTGSKKGKYHGYLGIPPMGSIKYGAFEKLVSISPLKDDYIFVKDKDGKVKFSYKDGVLIVFFKKRMKAGVKIGFKGNA